MKRRRVSIRVTDHAVIRYLERGLGVDVEALRAHIADIATDAAKLGAIGLKHDSIELVIEPDGSGRDGAARVTIPTVLERRMMGAISDAHRRRERRRRRDEDST